MFFVLEWICKNHTPCPVILWLQTIPISLNIHHQIPLHHQYLAFPAKYVMLDVLKIQI